MKTNIRTHTWNLTAWQVSKNSACMKNNQRHCYQGNIKKTIPLTYKLLFDASRRRLVLPRRQFVVLVENRLWSWLTNSPTLFQHRWTPGQPSFYLWMPSIIQTCHIWMLLLALRSWAHWPTRQPQVHKTVLAPPWLQDRTALHVWWHLELGRESYSLALHWAQYLKCYSQL